MKYFIIVPNWNGKKFIGECLESLKKQSTSANIVVADNGSGDGSVEYIKANFPKVHVLELDKNYGFAGGVNRGIEYAIKNGAEYIALLNNDAVADEKWLENLLQTMKKDNKTGIVTGKLMRSDKKHIDSTGEGYSVWGLPFPRGRNEVDHGQFDEPGEVFGASGGASLYRVKMLKQIGLFDEDFFAYFEDVDISFRAQLAGWKIIYTPKAVAYHHIGATSSKLGSFTRYHSIKNFILLYHKNMPLPLFVKYWPLFMAQLIRMKLGSIRDGQFGAFLKAYFKSMFLMPGLVLSRIRMQRKRQVSVKYIGSILYHKRPPRINKL